LSLIVHSLELLDTGSCRRDDQRIQTPREQPRYFLLLELRILLRRRHDQRIAFVPNYVGERSGNLCKEWVKEAGSHQTNQVAASRNQAAGEDVGLVVQLFYPCSTRCRVFSPISGCSRRTFETVACEMPRSFAMSFIRIVICKEFRPWFPALPRLAHPFEFCPDECHPTPIHRVDRLMRVHQPRN
jgi:hypothetical protein